MTTIARLSKTRLALVWMHLTREPLIALRSVLMAYVLYSELGATVFQLGLLQAIRPVMSLFSFYWGANLASRPSKILNNLIGAWLLGSLPFVFILFIDNVWYLLIAEALFAFSYRASVPALMEILKINMSAEKRSSAFALSLGLKFAESVILMLVFAAAAAKTQAAWRGLYCIAGLLSLTSVFWQRRIPLPDADPPQPLSWRQWVMTPLTKTVQLLRAHPDFFRFQKGFMIGGFGLMLISPAITIYTVDHLHATSNHVLLGRGVCMGLGVVISVMIWKQMLTRISLTRLLGFVIIGFAFYPFILLLGQFHFPCYYLAFFVYGIAQAGSHLLWNLSGPLFAKEEDSSAFSAVNVLSIGIRGMIAPALGSISCAIFGAEPVLIAGAFLLSIGSIRMLAQPASRAIS